MSRGDKAEPETKDDPEVKEKGQENKEDVRSTENEVGKNLADETSGESDLGKKRAGDSAADSKSLEQSGNLGQLSIDGLNSRSASDKNSNSKPEQASRRFDSTTSVSLERTAGGDVRGLSFPAQSRDAHEILRPEQLPALDPGKKK